MLLLVILLSPVDLLFWLFVDINKIMLFVPHKGALNQVHAFGTLNMDTSQILLKPGSDMEVAHPQMPHKWIMIYTCCKAPRIIKFTQIAFATSRCISSLGLDGFGVGYKK